MSPFRRSLWAAPLLMLMFATVTQAQEQELPPLPKNMPPAMRCYQSCNLANMKCQKECGKTARCTQTCTKQLATCTDACGGPPPPPQQQQ